MKQLNSAKPTFSSTKLIKNQKSKIVNCLLQLIMIYLFTACDKENAWDIVKTRGDRVVEQSVLPVFYAVKVGNGVNITLSQGDDYAATIEGWKNLMPKIRLSVDKDGVLQIEDDNRFNFVRSRDNMTTIYLTVAGELNHIHFSGNGYFVSNDTICTPGLTVLCEEASGSMELKVKAQGIYIGTNHQNVASITIGGRCNSVGITNWGNAPVNLSALKASSADVHHHGPGNLYVNASESISVVIYGMGDVYYLGNPLVTLTRKGKGNIYKMND